MALPWKKADEEHQADSTKIVGDKIQDEPGQGIMRMKTSRTLKVSGKFLIFMTFLLQGLVNWMNPHNKSRGHTFHSQRYSRRPKH
jgi:hypothetical protein